MKKFVLIFLLLFVVKVNAYENKTFKIDIPEEYKLDVNENNTYKWEKDNNYISISVDDNKTKRYDVNLFSDEDIKKQSEYIENGINKGLEEYDIKATVSDSKKVTINDNSVLEYKIYLPSKKFTGYDMYQIGRMYTTDKYILTVIYSSDKEINEESEYNKVIDSLEVLDGPIKYETTKKRPYIIIIVIGTVLGIIGYIIDHTKKRKK